MADQKDSDAAKAAYEAITVVIREQWNALDPNARLLLGQALIASTVGRMVNFAVRAEALTGVPMLDALTDGVRAAVSAGYESGSEGACSCGKCPPLNVRCDIYPDDTETDFESAPPANGKPC